MAMPMIRPRPSRTVVATLLRSVDLPAGDLTDAHMEHFFFAGTPELPLGVVGVELHGTSALLRSLAVAPGARSGGLGAALVAHAEAHARACHARSMYLLTTTAAAFFSGHGYRQVARESAPVAIRDTREFAELCPASSALMTKEL